MITGLFTSRARVFIISAASMAASDLANAKLATMLVNAKIASMNATKFVATKVIAKVTAFWMLLMSVLVPIHQTAPVVKPAIHAKQHKVAVAHKVTEVVGKDEPEEITEKPLFLHTFEKEYTAVFSGKVTCGEGICKSANIQVRIASKKNLSMTKTVAVEPDGSYTLSFMLKESPQEHMDWWIVADSPDSASKQIQGREILMEDSEVSIEQPVALL